MLKCYGRKTLLDRYVKADRIWSNIWEVPFYFLHGAWTCCLKYLFKIFIYYILYIYIYISNFLFLKNFPCVQKFSVLHVFVDFLFFLIKFCPSGTSIAEHFYLKKVLPGKVALDFLQFFAIFDVLFPVQVFIEQNFVVLLGLWEKEYFGDFLEFKESMFEAKHRLILGISWYIVQNNFCSSECAKKKLVPPENFIGSKTGDIFFRSLTYCKNNSGTWTEPCGTAHFTKYLDL